MSTAPTAQEQFDEEASNTLAAVYLTPDVVAQREKVLALLAPQAGERARAGIRGQWSARGPPCPAPSGTAA